MTASGTTTTTPRKVLRTVKRGGACSAKRLTGTEDPQAAQEKAGNRDTVNALKTDLKKVSDQRNR
jgi:hypothetical protein